MKEKRHGEEKEESGKKNERERERRRSLFVAKTAPKKKRSRWAAPSPLGRISKSNVIIKLSPCGPLRQLKTCIPIQIVLMKRPAHTATRINLNFHYAGLAVRRARVHMRARKGVTNSGERAEEEEKRERRREQDGTQRARKKLEQREERLSRIRLLVYLLSR